jgi:hypothetical protein
MVQEKVLAQDDPVAVSRTCPGYDGNIHREEVLRVLERAAEDNGFVAQLTYRGDEALQEYDLSWEEKAALLSGDIRWIEAHVGKLGARLRTWLDCRLQQEIW